MTESNTRTLAYYITELITPLKSFFVKAPTVLKVFYGFEKKSFFLIFIQFFLFLSLLFSVSHTNLNYFGSVVSSFRPDFSPSTLSLSPPLSHFTSLLSFSKPLSFQLSLTILNLSLLRLSLVFLSLHLSLSSFSQQLYLHLSPFSSLLLFASLFLYTSPYPFPFTPLSSSLSSLPSPLSHLPQPLSL